MLEIGHFSGKNWSTPWKMVVSWWGAKGVTHTPAERRFGIVRYRSPLATCPNSRSSCAACCHLCHENLTSCRSLHELWKTMNFGEALRGGLEEGFPCLYIRQTQTVWIYLGTALKGNCRSAWGEANPFFAKSYCTTWLKWQVAHLNQ